PFLPDPLGDGWYTVIDNRLLRVCFTTGHVTEVLALPEPAGDQDSTWELSPVREAPLSVAFNVDVEDAPTLLIDLQDRRIIDRSLDWPRYFHSWQAPVLVESEGTLVDEPVVDELLKVKESIDRYGHFGCDLTPD